MDLIRRTDGSVEPYRGLTRRSHLLPHERDICEQLGITSEEYFDFFDLLGQARERRAREYDLIPDIRNEPISLGTIAINLAIGLALTAVSALLAPKPRAPKQDERTPQSFQGADDRGPNKFTSTSQFDSIQDLAKLGIVLPLIFTRRSGGRGRCQGQQSVDVEPAC